MTHVRIWLGAALACGALTLWSCSSMSLGGSGSGGGGAGGAPSTSGASGRGAPGTGGGAGGVPDMGGGAGGLIGTGGGAGAGGTTGPGGAAGAGGAAGTRGAGSGGFPGTGGCFSIEFPGPVLSVFDAQTGTPICDPVFTIPVQTDAGLIFYDASARACTSPYDRCPTPGDGGTAFCPFYLGGLGYSMDTTVDVWAPGYEHTSVPGVSVGRAGCVPPFFPSSHLNVNLVPLPPNADAAADAQLSSTYAARE